MNPLYVLISHCCNGNHTIFAVLQVITMQIPAKPYEFFCLLMHFFQQLKKKKQIIFLMYVPVRCILQWSLLTFISPSSCRGRSFQRFVNLYMVSFKWKIIFSNSVHLIEYYIFLNRIKLHRPINGQNAAVSHMNQFNSRVHSTTAQESRLFTGILYSRLWHIFL